MEQEQKVNVLSENKIGDNPNEILYSINENLKFDLSFGVTKINIQGFFTSKMSSKKYLAFANDLSLQKMLDSNKVSRLR